MAFDTGYLMLEPVDDITRLDHAINAGLILAWVSLQGGDLVGTYGFDAAVRQYLGPIRGVSGFGRIQRATAELDYHHQETNFTLGLAELNARLKRRALVILFTDFVDTITAELLIEGMQRVANRHVVMFVTQRGSVLQRAVDAAPRQFADVAQAVIAHDFLRERSIVFERLERLGVHVPRRAEPRPVGRAHQPLSPDQAPRVDMNMTRADRCDPLAVPRARSAPSPRSSRGEGWGEGVPPSRRRGAKSPAVRRWARARATFAHKSRRARRAPPGHATRHAIRASSARARA